MSNFYTYLWLREDGTPYYVGKGKGDRGFTSEGHRVRCPLDVSLILVQEWPTETDALQAECFLISFYGRCDLGTGCLRNLTDGGEGLCNPSREVRAKMSEAARRTRNGLGKKRTPEQRQALSDAHKGQIPWTKGNFHSAATKDKISRAHTGKCFNSPEHYRKLSSRFKGAGNPFFGKSHSSATLAKFSASLKGRGVWNRGIPVTQERKDHLSNLLKGKPWSEKRRASHVKSAGAS